MKYKKIYFGLYAAIFLIRFIQLFSQLLHMRCLAVIVAVNRKKMRDTPNHWCINALTGFQVLFRGQIAFYFATPCDFNRRASYIFQNIFVIFVLEKVGKKFIDNIRPPIVPERSEGTSVQDFARMGKRITTHRYGKRGYDGATT